MVSAASVQLGSAVGSTGGDFSVRGLDDAGEARTHDWIEDQRVDGDEAIVSGSFDLDQHESLFRKGQWSESLRPLSKFLEKCKVNVDFHVTIHFCDEKMMHLKIRFALLNALVGNRRCLRMAKNTLEELLTGYDPPFYISVDIQRYLAEICYLLSDNASALKYVERACAGDVELYGTTEHLEYVHSHMWATIILQKEQEPEEAVSYHDCIASFVNGWSPPGWCGWTDQIISSAISSGDGKFNPRTLLLAASRFEVDAVNPEHFSTLLMYASRNGFTGTIESLLQQGADVNIRDKRGATALLDACGFSKRPAAVRKLLDAKAKLTSDHSQHGALHYAVFFFDNYEAVEVLLDHGDIDVCARTERGCTALMLACEFASTRSVARLLEYTAQSDDLLPSAEAHVNLRSNDGSTALHYAAANGYEMIVKQLLENNADGRIINDHSLLPSDEAAFNGHRAIIEIIGEHFSLFPSTSIWIRAALLNGVLGHMGLKRSKPDYRSPFRSTSYPVG